MTDYPLCPLCPDNRRRPMHDGAYVCGGCASDLARALERVANTAGEATTTISRQDRVGGGGRRTSPVWPLPYNAGASTAHDAAVNELNTCVRMISEESGVPMPTVRRAPCGHLSCEIIRWRNAYGPVCTPQPPEHPIAVAALWLREQLEWLRRHPDAEVAIRDLRSACWTLERVVDRPADRWYAGPCNTEECQEDLYPPAGAHKVRCRCGAEHDLDARKAWLLQEAEDVLGIANWCAAMLTQLGVKTPAGHVRKWAERNRLIAKGQDQSGRPLYRLGDVQDLAREAAQHWAVKQIREADKARAALTDDQGPVTLGAQAEPLCPQPA